MGKIPRVSIGLPVYNGEQFLSAALDSLRAQSFTDFEVIITDNCSSDSTAKICRSYVDADSRFRYHRNAANIGVDRNFNRSFELSCGEYFRWAAADDLCAPTLLQKCVQVLDARPEVVLCYPKTQIINEVGLPTGVYDDRLDLQSESPNKRLKCLLWRLALCNACYGLMRSSVLKRTMLYGSYFCSDTVFLAELVLHGPFVELPEYLFMRRIHPGIAVRKYSDRYRAMVMSEPNPKGKLFLPNWEIFIGHIRAVHRAPVNWGERLRCYARLHIWLRRWGSGLREDLIFNAKQFRGWIRRRVRSNRADSNSMRP